MPMNYSTILQLCTFYRPEWKCLRQSLITIIIFITIIITSRYFYLVNSQ